MDVISLLEAPYSKITPVLPPTTARSPSPARTSLDMHVVDNERKAPTHDSRVAEVIASDVIMGENGGEDGRHSGEQREKSISGEPDDKSRDGKHSIEDDEERNGKRSRERRLDSGERDREDRHASRDGRESKEERRERRHASRERRHASRRHGSKDRSGRHSRHASKDRSSRHASKSRERRPRHSRHASRERKDPSKETSRHPSRDRDDKPRVRRVSRERSRHTSKERSRHASRDRSPRERSRRSSRERRDEQPSRVKREENHSRERSRQPSRERRDGPRDEQPSRERSPPPSRERREDPRDARDVDSQMNPARRQLIDSNSSRRDRSSPPRRGSQRERSPPPPPRPKTTVKLQRSPSPELLDPLKRAQRSVFITQISARLKARDLGDFLRQVGKVREVKIVEDKVTRRSKGVAYVEFADENSVPKAIGMTGQILFGIPIIIQPSQAELNKADDLLFPTRQVDQFSNKLFVENLPQIVSEQDLKDLFEPFGRIESINLHVDAISGKSKGFSFVVYKHMYDAKDAQRAMNNFTLMGRAIKVSHVVDKAVKLVVDEDGEEGVKSMSRIELMAKLSRDTVRTTNDRTNQSQILDTNPSVCLSLKNMFDASTETEEGWQKELQEDVRVECEKFGPVLHLGLDEAGGKIYVKFGSLGAAHVALTSLNGRFFAGVQIEATFVPEGVYRQRYPGV